MIAVITATAKEMKAAFAQADNVPTVEQGESVEYELGGRKLLLVVTGVGIINSALVLGELLARGDVKGVVNLGIAGAFDTGEFPLGTVCMAWHETWPEYGLLLEGGDVDPEAIGFAQGKINGEVVWDRLKLNPVNEAEVMKLTLPEGCQRAGGLTVSSVTGEPIRAGWLKAAYTADMENMEGFALAFGCGQKNISFLEIRIISNLVGSRYAEDWDVKLALKKLGEATMTLFAAQ